MTTLSNFVRIILSFVINTIQYPAEWKNFLVSAQIDWDREMEYLKYFWLNLRHVLPQHLEDGWTATNIRRAWVAAGHLAEMDAYGDGLPPVDLNELL